MLSSRFIFQRLRHNFILRNVFFFVKQMMDKELNFFAASLSFYTLSTIVPLFVIILTILTNLKVFTEYYLDIKTFLFENFMPVHSEKIMALIDQFISNSVGLGIISLLIMVFSSLLFFQNFEFIANRIFRVKEKNFFHSLGIYFVFVTVVPIGLGATFLISYYIHSFFMNYDFMGWLNFIKIIPYLIIWTVFFIIYKISINTKIKWKVLVSGALINAIIWVGAKNMFVYYVVFNQSYKTLYGSFAFILYFLLWIYVSWLIFIYGIKLLYLIHKYYNRKIAHDKATS